MHGEQRRQRIVFEEDRTAAERSGRRVTVCVWAELLSTKHD